VLQRLDEKRACGVEDRSCEPPSPGLAALPIIFKPLVFFRVYVAMTVLWYCPGLTGGVLFSVPRLIESRTLTPTPPAGRPWSGPPEFHRHPKVA
jgi:hypothetical protein